MNEPMLRGAIGVQRHNYGIGETVKVISRRTFATKNRTILHLQPNLEVTYRIYPVGTVSVRTKSYLEARSGRPLSMRSRPRTS